MRRSKMSGERLSSDTSAPGKRTALQGAWPTPDRSISMSEAPALDFLLQKINITYDVARIKRTKKRKNKGMRSWNFYFTIVGGSNKVYRPSTTISASDWAQAPACYGSESGLGSRRAVKLIAGWIDRAKQNEEEQAEGAVKELEDYQMKPRAIMCVCDAVVLLQV